MPKTSLVILLLCFLSLTIALTPTLDKKYFFLNSNNFLSQELHQTRNGVIAHNIEEVNSTQISRYILVDVPSKEVSSILADTVSACEFADPLFQHLHYHVQTDSLVYFCPKNTSLLVIDQSNYTVQTSIPFTLQGSWSAARLSTDGANLAVLGLGSLSTAAPQNSMLVKVNMQTKEVVTQILFDQGLSSDELVAAFASNKKAAYIATNKIQGIQITTTIYSILTIGNTYQLTPISNFSTLDNYQTITKLFCLGNYIVTNNGQNLYFINQQGTIIQKGQLRIKSINSDSQHGPFQPFMTSYYGSSYLYVISAFSSVDRYSVVDNAILVKSINGSYSEIQVAPANQTSHDLMFTLDYARINFSIVDLQTLKPTYSAICGYDKLILTSTTYAVVQFPGVADYHVYIFDLKTDALIKSLPIDKNYHYNKDQQIISYLNSTGSPGCHLEHIDLATGNLWTTLNFTGESQICLSWVINLRITEKGNPELVLPFTQFYIIITEAYGQILFPATSSASVNYDSLNINFDTLSAYYLVAKTATNQIKTSLYSYNPQSNKFDLKGSNILDNIPVQHQGFFTVNNDMTIALSPSSFTLIDKLYSSASHIFPSDWNIASSFQDPKRNQYVLGTYSNMYYPRGSYPRLFAIGSGFVDLPGLQSNTVRGQAAGLKSYWLHDDINSAFGLIRFFNAGTKKTLISL